MYRPVKGNTKKIPGFWPEILMGKGFAICIAVSVHWRAAPFSGWIHQKDYPS
jgi:hypothetical protein